MSEIESPVKTTGNNQIIYNYVNAPGGTLIHYKKQEVKVRVDISNEIKEAISKEDISIWKKAVGNIILFLIELAKRIILN